jgi:hypothetical protein
MALEYHWGGGGLGDGVVVWLSDAYALGGYRGGGGEQERGHQLGKKDMWQHVGPVTQPVEHVTNINRV